MENNKKYIDINNLKYFEKDKEKIYYNGSIEIGKEYDVIKMLILTGLSSSMAHKLIRKIRKAK